MSTIRPNQIKSNLFFSSCQ